MSVLANQGPLVIFKSNPLSTVGTGSAGQNPDEGPNLEHIGGGLLDPRQPFTYYPGMGQFVGGTFATPTIYGHMGGDYVTIDQVPSTASASNIAGSQSPAAGAINLVTSSAAGVTINVSITRADTGATVTGLLAIDNPMRGWQFGQSGAVGVWDPTTAISRAVSITSGSNDGALTFTVSGYDIYGYPMSENITGASGAAANGKKAFKYISSVTHTGSVAGTLTVGTQDLVGLPLRSDRFPDVTGMFWNSQWITTPSTGYTAAVTTNPATTTTGDVRGTISLSGVTGGASSNGTLRLTVYQAPSVINVASGQAQTATISNASPGVVTINSNGFSANQTIQFTTTGGLPAPLVPCTTYYVIAPTTNTFNVALTAGGAAINTTSAGSGTHTCYSYASSTIQTCLYGVAQNLASNNG